MAQTPGALYFSHMRDGPLIRIRLPGGRVSSGQLRVVASLAGRFGNGRIDLTNLANLQVRGLKSVQPAQLKAMLKAADLLPRAAWADRFRNIQADPLTGLVEDELIDAGPVIASLDEALQNTPVLKACYNKFSYVVDGGGPSHIRALPHDVGLVAERGRPGLWWRLYLAGVPTPFCARPGSGDAPALAIAAARMALQFPDRSDSLFARRLKQVGFAPQGGGVSALARAVLALSGQQENRIRRLVKHVSLEDMVARLPAFLATPCEQVKVLPKTLPKLTPSIGVLAQGGGELKLCGFGVPLGRLEVKSLELIAQLAEEFGRGKLRFAPWHVVFIPHVKAQDAKRLLRKARESGFITDQSFLHVDVSACSGREGCRGARLATPDHAFKVMQAFAGQGDSERFAPLSIHVSGCPKGCAHRAPSDILALEREDASGYYVYERSSALAPQKQTRLAQGVTAESLPQVIRELATRQAGTNTGLETHPASGHKRQDATKGR